MSTLSFTIINALNPSGYSIPTPQEWSEEVSSRTEMLTVPRRDGGILDDYPMLQPRTISIKGVIKENTLDLAKASLDLLRLNTEYYGKIQLKFINDRILYAVKGTCNYSWIKGFSGRLAEYELTFIAEDPYWYSTTGEVPGSQALSAGDTSFTITSSAGNAKTNARFKIIPTGSLTYCTIYNGTAGIEQCGIFSGAVSSGGSIVIDSSDKSCYVDLANYLSYYSGDFVMLKCGAANSFNVYSNVTGTIYWYYTDRWY
jgi:phage-related protein